MRSDKSTVPIHKFVSKKWTLTIHYKTYFLMQRRKYGKQQINQEIDVYFVTTSSNMADTESEQCFLEPDKVE